MSVTPEQLAEASAHLDEAHALIERAYLLLTQSEALMAKSKALLLESSGLRGRYPPQPINKEESKGSSIFVSIRARLSERCAHSLEV